MYQNMPFETEIRAPGGSDGDPQEAYFITGVYESSTPSTPPMIISKDLANTESSSLEGGTTAEVPLVPLCVDALPCDIDDPLPNASGSQLRSRRLSESTAASSLSSDNRSLPLRYMSATTDNLGLDNRAILKLSQSNPDIFSHHNQQDPSMTVQFTFGGLALGGAIMRQVSGTSDGGSGQESRQSNGGNTASGNWGWFEDVHEQDGQDSGSGDKKSGTLAAERNRKGTLLHFSTPFAGSLHDMAPTNKGTFNRFTFIQTLPI